MSDSVEDIEMSDISSIVETPHSAVPHPRSSRTSDSMDSGYLSLTPHSFGTPSARARRPPALTRRHYWLRSEHWQLDRRPRSKLNSLINASACLAESSESLAPEHPDSALEGSSAGNSLSLDSPGDESRYSFRKGLREYRSRARKAQRASAVTPASIPILSPPPSPAIPSASFVACEPIDEKEKMVRAAQSTPYDLRVTLASVDITFSPKTSKSPGEGFSSVERKEFSNLSIGSAEIKPKRLDFSQRTYGGYRTRSIPDVTGRETVDILHLLGEKSNHLEIVSKILGYLRAEDLCAVSMVSRTWRSICGKDVMANMRRITHVCVRQSTKENLRRSRKAKESGIQESPKSRFARGYLVNVQNFLMVPKRGNPRSPPVSPSKIKWNSYVKASRRLAPSDRLFSCPKCNFACPVNTEKNVGTCTREGCSIEFCTHCLSTPHTGLCKTPLLATPTKRKTPPLIVGSKQSKRNLRRL
ncbi:F-box only protein 43 [Diachasma alloeum]|uniref:F-box only protein 43 n=1 Tax=Diachasma alloeum TaxID=454923 RepID=UPI00073813F5|nr:F-box only protein 43 [Diachasma alloeum]